MPGSRCLNGFVCFSHNSINPSAVWLVPKPTGGGYCVKLSQPGNNFWNRRGRGIVVCNDSVGGCLSGAVSISPGASTTRA